MNSTSATATPARSAIAMPSPVERAGLVVTAKHCPAPPVARSVWRARTSTSSPSGSSGPDAGRTDPPRRGGRARASASRTSAAVALGRRDQRPLDLGAGCVAAGVHDSGDRVAAFPGQRRSSRPRRRRCGRTPPPWPSARAPGRVLRSPGTRTASASQRPAPAASVSERCSSGESSPSKSAAATPPWA